MDIQVWEMFPELEIDIFSADRPGVWFDRKWLKHFVLFLNLAYMSLLIWIMLMMVFWAINWWWINFLGSAEQLSAYNN